MDDENNGKPQKKWMIWGENPLFLETSKLDGNFIKWYQIMGLCVDLSEAESK